MDVHASSPSPGWTRTRANAQSPGGRAPVLPGPAHWVSTPPAFGPSLAGHLAAHRAVTLRQRCS